MPQVILYYNFTPIPNPAEFCQEHKEKCNSLKLTGRVFIAYEGINGTLAGTVENISIYKKYLCGLSGLEKTEFKEDECEYNPFYKLIVRLRPEIVSLKVPISMRENGQGGRYLTPRQWRQILESEEDFILLDVRNHYESKIGHFKGALTPPLENFFDFPTWLEGANLKKEKKILMYCTGGIRCEKFSVLLKDKGYQNIFQLKGGILNYAKEERGAHFRGRCFVFDGRLAVQVDPEQPEPISRCEISGVPCDTYLNCANMECNKLFICSKEAAIKMEGCCSAACKNARTKRLLDADKIYQPFRKWYHYFQEKFGSDGLIN